MTDHSIARIGELAEESILFEVAATPKPGLVDRVNNGAHDDMNFFTFMKSAAALKNFFDTFATIGKFNADEPVEYLFSLLRAEGILAEREMFRATNNVNTHKGMIFIFAILTGLAGRLAGRNEKFSAERIGELAAVMCAGLCKREYANLSKKNKLTKGEAVYLKYGVAGVRGEAESGFRSVLKISLPTYRLLRSIGVDVNDALVDTFIHLLAKTQDTNILGRHDLNTLNYVHQSANAVIAKGSIHTSEGKKAIIEMDEDFIERRISPGGTADLLAATHFLYELERIN